MQETCILISIVKSTYGRYVRTSVRTAVYAIGAYFEQLVVSFLEYTYVHHQ